MEDKKFLIECCSKVRKLINPGDAIGEFLHQGTDVLKRHWEATYTFNEDILYNKKCVDIGIWWGICNAYALKKLKLQTTHGFDPSKDFRDICSKLLPDTKLYSTIDDLTDTINTDVIFMLGLIPFFGTEWKEQLDNILQKITASYIIIRHQTFDAEEFKYLDSKGKEYNILGVTNYNQSAKIEDVIQYLQEKQWKLIKKHEELDYKTSNVYTFQNDN